MATPAMLAGQLLRLLMLAMTAFWTSSFLLIRTVVFVEAFNEVIAIQRDEAWLLRKCSDAEFHLNLRRHTDLCDQVHRNAERNPYLYAFGAVAQTAHLCGRHSCAQVLAWLGEGGWATLIWMGLALFIGNMLLCLLQRFCALKRDPRVFKDVCFAI